MVKVFVQVNEYLDIIYMLLTELFDADANSLCQTEFNRRLHKALEMWDGLFVYTCEPFNIEICVYNNIYSPEQTNNTQLALLQATPTICI